MSYRVSRRELERGVREERKEHPTLSDRMVTRVARDHIQKYGPGYYQAEPVTEKIIAAKTASMGAKPKRKRAPRPFDPMTDGIPHTGHFWNI